MLLLNYFHFPMNARQKILLTETTSFLGNLKMIDVTVSELSAIIGALEILSIEIEQLSEKQHTEDEEEKAFSLSTSTL